MKSIQLSLSAMALVALAGCAPVMNNAGDSGVSVDRPNPTGDTPGAACAEPAHPNPGAAIGTDFENVVMPYCDDSQFSFYANNFCSSQITLIILSAGWCGPCQAEARILEDAITQNPDYVGKVRVVTVYGQNVNRTVATARECAQWRDRYGLTSHMVYDPMGVMQRVFPNQAYPSNLIVDRNGRIQSREYGASQGLQSLKNELDRLLQ